MEWLALILVPLYAVADRFAGGGAPAVDDRLPGRALLWSAFIVFGFGLLIGWEVAFIGVVWGVYRCLPFDGWGGDLAPRTRKQLAQTAFRHALPALGFVIVGPDWIVWSLAYATAATAVAAWVAASVAEGRDTGGRAEWYRGAAFGACLALWWIVRTGWGGDA